MPRLLVFLLFLTPAWGQSILNELAFEPVASGFVFPVAATHAGDGSGRLFVTERGGRIWVLDRNFDRTLFLDIRERVRTSNSTRDERGLFSIAFPPDFASSQVFYVNYIGPTGGTVVSRFRVTADPNRADPASETVFLEVPQPFGNHNGGQLHFGPDGYLYIGMGDGGSGNDPSNNAQTLTTLLGKMLRVDVSQGPPARPAPGNPFLEVDNAQPEIWSYGLRNPWRFSFDRMTGDLFIGDVGQGAIEEISFEPAGSAGGLNFGWRRMEGSRCNIPGSNCNDGTLTLPILEYSHNGPGNCRGSVTGGYVYRGALSPALQGVYLFGDFCTGNLYGGVREGGGWRRIGPAPTPWAISSFGEDEAGEIYLVAFSEGGLYRIQGPQPPPAISQGGVVSAASFAAGPVAPGSIVSVFGQGLGTALAAANGAPLPTGLGGARFRIGGLAAPLFFVSPGQANLQIPWELEGQAVAAVQATVAERESPPLEIELAAQQPAIFTLEQSGAGQAAALIAGTGMIAAPRGAYPNSRPARIGEALEIFATGLGAVTNRPLSGAAAPAEPLAETVDRPTVRVGGVEPARVVFAGLAPGFVGLYQVNIELVGDFPSGAAVEIQIFQSGAASNLATIAIE